MPLRSAPHVGGSPPTDDTIALQRAASVLRDARSVTVVCHENPDADTLGAGLALARSLSDPGRRDVEVVCASDWPSTLAFLPGIDGVRREPGLRPDAIVLADCASIDRAGPAVAGWIRDTTGAVVNVDHHRSNDGYGTVACVDPSAAATSEVMAHLIATLGCTLDAEGATLLLAGVLHDTDGLRVPATSPATLRLAADLVESGADFAAINGQLFNRRPLPALRLWGRIVSGLETELDGRIVIGTLTDDLLTETGATLLDAEDLPELIAAVEGASVALLLREVGPEATRVSIRSSGAVDAAHIASSFGGGGHERAAGCTLPEGTSAARERLVAACARELSGSEEGR